MERTMSMSSFHPRSEVSRTGAQTVNSDRQHERELGLSRRGLNPVQADAASDTSSQRERKFANLLGGSEDGSDRDVSPSGRNIGHRLYHTGCGRERAKQERLREERERLLMNEMAQMTQRPNITGRARSKMNKGAHFADHAALWSAQRDHHLRKAAQEVAAERCAEIKEKPTINPRSVSILNNSGEYKGPVRHWKEHCDKFAAKKLGCSAPQGTFRPNINANAVRVDVERSISDRLFQESAARRERLQKASHEQQALEMIDPATGRPFFAPHSLRPAAHRDPLDVSAQLHDDSYDVQRRREVAQQSHPDTQHTFKPHINPASEVLAKGRRPLYVSRAQRLLEEQAKREKVQRSRSSEVSPRPQTGPVNVDDFLRRAQRNEMTRAAKLDSARKHQDERETRECTFHPTISPTSEEIFFASNVSGTPMRSPLEPNAMPLGSPSANGSPRSPYGASPNKNGTPNKLSARARAATAADDFAAVMAASGLAGGKVGDRNEWTAPKPNRVPTPRTAEFDSSRAASTGRSEGAARSQPRGGAGGAHQGAGMGDVEQYITAFESQMYSVLEEWRKLEEV